MAEDKNNNDLVFDGMPGADAKTEEDVKPFEVDMNFENTEEEVEEVEEEETTEEEPVTETATEEVAEEQVEEPVAQEAESEEQTTEQESVPTDDGQLVEPVAEEPQIEEPKAPMVPKSRLDEVLAKNKEMQKRIQDMEGEAKAENEGPKYDFVSKEKEYQEFVLDGETDLAAQLREEIRSAEREQMMSEMQSKMGQTVQQDREAHELNKKANEIMEVFPVFDQKSAQFDERLANEVMELRDAFIFQGYGAADSLAKATEVTLIRSKPELLDVQTDDVANAAPTLDKVVQEKKKQANVSKKVQASQSQPPQMKGESTQNKKVVDINVLSDDEFGALPEETLRRMRGDFD